MKRFDVYVIAIMALSVVVVSSMIFADAIGSTKPARPDDVGDFQMIRETEKGWLLLKTSSGKVCFVPAKRIDKGWCIDDPEVY